MKVLVTGANGRLGRRVVAALHGHEVVEWRGSRDLDLRDLARVRRELDVLRPDVCLNTAAMSAVSACFRAPEEAGLVNTALPALLAAVVPRVVHCSTDMVFDGTAAPYREEAAVAPLSVYGRTKAEGEREVLASGGHLVARLALMYNLGDPVPPRLFVDEWRTPIQYHEAAEALVRLALGAATGLVHVGGPERLSRYELGLRLVDASLIAPVSQADIPAEEPRARDLSLDSSRLRDLLA